MISEHLPSPSQYHELRHPLLTEEQEHALAERIAAGDASARNELALSNLRLVVADARNSTRKKLPLSDRIQEGNIGMLRATNDFDPVTHGTRFSTYAHPWIRTNIDRAADQEGVIYVPRETIDDLALWTEKSAELKRQSGSEPSMQDVARALGYEEKYVEDAVARILDATKARRAKSTDAPIGGKHKDDTFGRFLSSPSRKPIDILIEREERASIPKTIERVREAIACSVDPHQAKVLMRRLFYFDSGDAEQPTLRDLQKEMGTTYEAIRKNEAAGTARLLEALRHQELPGSAIVDRLWKDETEDFFKQKQHQPDSVKIAERFGLRDMHRFGESTRLESLIANGGPHGYEMMTPDQFDELLMRISKCVDALESTDQELVRGLLSSFSY